jgi:hypothetical protein
MKIVDKFWKIVLTEEADAVMYRILFGALIGALILECLILDKVI